VIALPSTPPAPALLPARHPRATRAPTRADAHGLARRPAR
jgi:hypothetical protein